MGFLSKEICTREQFLESFGKRGKGLLSIAILDEHGIFPLTYNNPKLPVLNVLGLYTYLSGSLSATHSNNIFGSISRNRHQQADLSNVVLAELGLGLRKRLEPMRTEKGRNGFARDDHDFGRNGGSYARLLSQMGFHTSYRNSEGSCRKATMGSRLPCYLTSLITHYPELGIEGKKTARKLLRDFVSVYFDTKGNARNRNHSNELSLELLTQPNEQLVREQGHSIIDAMNIIYPQMELLWNHVSVNRQKNGLYEGRIYIPFESALRFPRGPNSPGSIEIKLNLRPSRYSFD